MPDVNRGKRPLSPFMLGPYYRLQITSVSSILTRITGLAMLVAALLIVWWLLAASAGPEAFDRADGVLTSWIIDIVMTLSVLALWYHALAGLRHLYWDTGRGLEVATAERLGIAAMVGSVILTLITILLV
ncbi:succinate dehydrogenase, cytochrome b556 subunit [Roseicyclus sp. F158]|uniref:Succinate dehydrogenase cytochrome b556 subunit n=1 Tax=Tropicimonas omnivorans TaxID=3075590 RepID=A0ABU3DDF6_9RHOB|nr:succinate dehydrogenase, cytochrome b556 subunit [Roseicyclus sp. F158]MDT0681742.1 succinate dehydrogenase, cytochrome b556 subunit [Roseicyclus sp. F158]